MTKAPDAFRTISEVAEELDLPQHVLRFWETRFSQIKPMKRGGGRRYYRPDDINLLRGIRYLLYSEGYTIKGVQRILKEQGVRVVATIWSSPDAGQIIQTSTVELKKEPEAEEVVPVSTKETSSSSQLVDLTAGFQVPEDIAGIADSSVAKEERQETSSSPPFVVTHSIPGHLVDAITTDPSSVETTLLDEEIPKRGGEVTDLPSDILSEDDVTEVPKGVRRGLLGRLKSGEAGKDSKVPADTALGPAEIERLQGTLVDLLECKRLLDQIR